MTKLKQAKVLFASGFMSSTLSLCMWLNIQKYLQKGAGRDGGEKGRSREAKGFMLLFTSGNFPAVPRVMAFTVRERRREGGRKAPRLSWGRRIKARGQIRKQKAECGIQPKQRGHFLDRRRKKKRCPNACQDSLLSLPEILLAVLAVVHRGSYRGKTSQSVGHLQIVLLKNIQENSYLKFSHLLAQKNLLIKSRQFSLPFST